MFDWCFRGDHEGCHKSFKVFYVDNKNRIIYTGEERVCDCWCHQPKAPVPSKPKRKKK